MRRIDFPEGTFCRFRHEKARGAGVVRRLVVLDARCAEVVRRLVVLEARCAGVVRKPVVLKTRDGSGDTRCA